MPTLIGLLMTTTKSFVQAREITDAHVYFGQTREQLHRIFASWSEKNLGKNLSFSQNRKRFELLIKEEKMRYWYRQVFLVYREKEKRYEITYPLPNQEIRKICQFTVPNNGY